MITITFLPLLLLIRCFSNSAQQSIGFGRCPRMEVIKNFDVSKFVGVWYEQYRYFFGSEIGTTCAKLNLTHTEDGLKFTVSFFDVWEKRNRDENGIAKFSGAEEESKFVIFFPDKGNVSTRFWVLDTDYDSYSVMWSCRKQAGHHSRTVWIFTREQFPLKRIIRTAIIAIKKQSLSPKYLFKTDQINCRSLDDEYDDDDYYDYYDNEINPDAEEIDI